MPWEPHFNQAEAHAAIEGATTWTEVLAVLEYTYHGKNIQTVREWADRWGISTQHLPDRRGRRPRYSPDELRHAIASSASWADTLRRLGYCPTGGNWKTLKRRARELGISTNHFDPYAASRRRRPAQRFPLGEVLVEGSTYNRQDLKRRLYEEGWKQRRCELCGQGELWQGVTIALILDHVNGVRDDNRLENLRIVCPNCAATLDTHCGRKTRVTRYPRSCRRCAKDFVPRSPRQRYCSRECGIRWDRRGRKLPGARRVDRPPPARLRRDVEEVGYSAVGRRYGVSDNAIRKWLREYERERSNESRDGKTMEIPTRTWPKRRRHSAGDDKGAR